MRLRSGQSCASSQNLEKHFFMDAGLCNVMLKTTKGLPHTVTTSTTNIIKLALRFPSIHRPTKSIQKHLNFTALHTDYSLID